LNNQLQGYLYFLDSQLFCQKTVEQTLGSTAAHTARMQETLASTVQRMHQEALPAECERLSKQAWHEADNSSSLVLGVDDYAIKKGHTYNTGIHNLRVKLCWRCWHDENWRICVRMLVITLTFLT
jgi:transposase